MVFMNKKRPNKTVLWVIVVFISLGLLGTVGGWMFTPRSISTGNVPAGGSSEEQGNSYFAQAMDKISKNDYEGAEKLLKNAITQYEKSLEETPENKLVLGDLATSYFYTGNTEKAIELVKKALEIDPNFTNARMNYAIYLGDGQKKYMEAIKELEKIKPENPSYQQAQQLKQMYFDAISSSGQPK